MHLRPLGRSGLSVSPLCFGGNVFGWTADEATSHALLDRFVDAGGNFIDTANVYSHWVPGHSGGESESIIGRWLKKRGRRNDIIVATKVGMEMQGVAKGLKRAQIQRGVDDSLRRLQIDCIDLYYAHRDDTDTPLEETLAALDRLVKDGKVRALAASNYTAERLEAALAFSVANGLSRFECLQPLYNLMDREPFESTLAPVCERHGLGVANYYCARGRVPQRQVPPPRRCRGPRTCRQGEGLSQRARMACPWCARCGSEAAGCNAGSGGARMVAGPANSHGADRQCDDDGAARSVGEGR